MVCKSCKFDVSATKPRSRIGLIRFQLPDEKWRNFLKNQNFKNRLHRNLDIVPRHRWHVRSSILGLKMRGDTIHRSSENRFFRNYFSTFWRVSQASIIEIARFYIRSIRLGELFRMVCKFVESDDLTTCLARKHVFRFLRYM